MTIGVLFALTEEDEKLLADCPAAARPALIGEDIEERYSHDWFCDTDKAWDAIHRAFNDSLLTYDFKDALQGIILGGAPLYGESDYIISYKTADEVKKISEALSKVSEPDFRVRYFTIREDEYGEMPSEDDLAYVWDNLVELKTFYNKAAGAKRCVIFTAAQ